MSSLHHVSTKIAWCIAWQNRHLLSAQLFLLFFIHLVIFCRGIGNHWADRIRVRVRMPKTDTECISTSKSTLVAPCTRSLALHVLRLSFLRPAVCFMLSRACLILTFCVCQMATAVPDLLETPACSRLGTPAPSRLNTPAPSRQGSIVGASPFSSTFNTPCNSSDKEPVWLSALSNL